MVLFRASGRRGSVALILGVAAPTLLLITDDGANKIWRVTYVGAR